jgi:hypothetical protein
MDGWVQEERLMSWAVSLSARSRSAVAVTLGTMATVLALSMPDQAFAMPTPPLDPDCQLDPNNPECQNGPNGVPTNPDSTGCFANPYAIGCDGGAYDLDPTINDFPSDPLSS